MSYGISLIVDNNDYDSDLSYTLTGVNTSNNGNIIPDINDNVPIINSTKIYELGVGSFTKATNAVHTYNFKIFFLDNGKDQNLSQGANFAAHLVITSVNPDGSVVYNGTGRSVVLSEQAKVNNITKSFNVANYVNQETDYEMFLIVNENTYDNLTYSIKGTNVSSSGSMISNVSDVLIPSEADNTISLGKGKLSDLNTKHTYDVTFNENVSETNLSNISKQVDTKLLRKSPYTFSGKIEIVSGGKTLYSAVIGQGFSTSSKTTIGLATDVNEGLIKSTDDYGDMYYYRGKSDSNYVSFAGMCWRIVRTTGNNDVKLVLYNNNSSDCTITGNALAYAKTTAGLVKTRFNNGNVTTINDTNAESTGFMYGLFNESGNSCLFEENGKVVNKISNYASESACINANGKWASDAYTSSFANVKKSEALVNLEKWYEEKLIPYTDKLSDVIWCNDKSISDASNSSFLFGIAGRTSTGPSFICPNDYVGGNLNKYTVSSDFGNQSLTYPVGLLTGDEVVYAGANINQEESGYYLKDNAGFDSWTLTPAAAYPNDGATMVYMNGSKINILFTSGQFYLRPVIALKNSVMVIGSGKASDPFKILG